MQHPVVLAVTVASYDAKNGLFTCYTGANGRTRLKRDELHDLLSLVGATDRWEHLPCACKAPESDHAGTDERKGDAVVLEFGRHTTDFKQAFWEWANDTDLKDAAEIEAWIADTHPILCCEKRHQDKVAMLQYSENTDK